MKNVSVILGLLVSTSLFGQTTNFVDSLNYYFEILLRHDRDSVNQYRIENNVLGEADQLWILKTVTVETDKDLYVKPDESLDYNLQRIQDGKSYTPHFGFYIDNFHLSLSTRNRTDEFSNPKILATFLYNGWKTSPKGHYLMMISDPKFYNGHNYDYETFIVKYKISYNPNKPNPWVMVASMTVYKRQDRVKKKGK